VEGSVSINRFVFSIFIYEYCHSSHIYEHSLITICQILFILLHVLADGGQLQEKIPATKRVIVAGPSGRAVLRRRSAAARMLRSWVWIPPWAWMFVCCECCVLSERGLCDGLITPPEESYRLWCVVVCDLETSWMRRPWPTGGCRAKNLKACCY